MKKLENKTHWFFHIMVIMALFLFVYTDLALSDAWVQKANMPSKRFDHASCVFNGIIYVFGGWTSSALATVEAYDPSTNTWTKKTDMPTPRECPSACEVNGIIYVMGGWGISSSYIPVVEAYNPATDTWTKKADMPLPNGYMGTCVINGVIYTIGGWTPRTDVYAYYPATDTWVKKADMPTARGLFGTSVVNGIIYVMGGQNSNSGITSAVEAYDPGTDTWVIKKNMFSSSLFVTCAMGNLIYAIDGLGVPRSVQVYDPTMDTWKAIEDSGYSTRWQHTAEVVNGKIYAIGGYTGSEAINTVKEYDPLRAPRRPLSVDSKDKLATLWGEVKTKD